MTSKADVQAAMAAFLASGGEVKQCAPGDNAIRLDKRDEERRQAEADAYTDWTMRQGEQGRF